MKPTILRRLRELGARTDQVRGESLPADWQAITFDSVLYFRPTDTPWAAAADTEPIVGANAVVEANRALLTTQPEAFYQQVADHFYQLTDEPHGQVFARRDVFTPFRPGTPDYDEWNDEFTDLAAVDLSALRAITTDEAPDFLCIAFSYGFPDTYYVCLADPQPDNPTVFGTDHEEFFCPLTSYGSLDDFLQRFMSRDEFGERLRQRLNPNSNK
jgi:hypothetical protein